MTRTRLFNGIHVILVRRVVRNMNKKRNGARAEMFLVGFRANAYRKAKDDNNLTHTGRETKNKPSKKKIIIQNDETNLYTYIIM